MTSRPDPDTIRYWAEQVIKDVAYLRAALRGEPTPPLRITATPGPQIIPIRPRTPVPLASLRDRERYRGTCEAQRTALTGMGTYICNLPAGHDGDYHKVMDGVTECARWPQVREDAPATGGDVA